MFIAFIILFQSVSSVKWMNVRLHGFKALKWPAGCVKMKSVDGCSDGPGKQPNATTSLLENIVYRPYRRCKFYPMMESER